MHVCMFQGALFFFRLIFVCMYLFVCMCIIGMEQGRLINPSVSEWYRKNNIREEASDRGVREEI